MGDVEALVALQANEVGAQGAGRGGRERRLADAGLAFEKQRAPQAERQVQCHRQPALGHIVLIGELLLRSSDTEDGVNGEDSVTSWQRAAGSWQSVGSSQSAVGSGQWAAAIRGGVRLRGTRPTRPWRSCRAGPA